MEDTPARDVLKSAEQVIAEAEKLVEIADDVLLEVSAVAIRLNVSTWTVRRWVKIGKVIAVRTPTNGYRVPRSELVRILLSRTCNTCIVSTR